MNTAPTGLKGGRVLRIHPKAVLFAIAALVLRSAALPSASAAEGQSIARTWNERALGAIRNDTPHPPAQARNLFSLSVCMYDAWAAYDATAVGYVYRGKHTANDVASARREAISYAAFRILNERHVYSRTASNTLAANLSLMTSLGYDPSNVSRDVSTPAGLGNSIYDAVSQWFLNDGARQTNGTPYPAANPPVAYPDAPAAQGGYNYINPPLATALPGIDDGNGKGAVDINRWQRLQVVNAVDQNGFPQGPIQNYLGAQWLGVRPFALARTDSTKPWFDPGPPPLFGTASHAEFISNIVVVIDRASQLTPDDGVIIDISPGAFGNNSLGANDGKGHPINPVTGQPYAPNMVKRGDFARVLTEFWADGPSSETPPGHWNTVANDMSEHPAFERRIGGTGAVVDELEWDVKLYFALNGAVHDAACTAWSIKRFYDGWRPISAIRYAGLLGQSSDSKLPAYNPNGLPLITNLIELVTPASIASGRHAGLTAGKVAVRCWPGQPPNPASSYQGVKWMLAENWTTYQKTNFVSPAFPGYVSGHSTFSRSAAEVLTGITGSPFFPGGMGTYSVPADTGLVNEKGPSQPVQLQWGTYYDAADQAGISRIWGGIHPPADDFAGRRAGALAGKAAWALAQKYWDGSITKVELAIRKLSDTQIEVGFTTRRGFQHQEQSSPDLNTAFANTGSAINQPYDILTVLRTNSLDGASRFFRVIPVE
ncbi:MAG: vanadium-dependent haloperoxidase [Verrucomicrobiales bacterium]|nr:vanadium-dependent haloperoxidase [Verrucomicrobiales bacterium]